MLTFICVMHKGIVWRGNLAWVCGIYVCIYPPYKNAPGMLFIWYVSIGISFLYFETSRPVFAQEILSIHMDIVVSTL